MKFYFTIPPKLHPFYQKELDEYRTALQNNDLQLAWSHLERAHILGQRYPLAHSYVHLKMLQFGIQIKSTKEVMGQIPRLFVGGVKSFVGKVPVGNPGGSNVPPLKSFPIENELSKVFIKAGLSPEGN
ncbi:MAG: DUF3703 domain-containing protein [Vicingaceae bacterium]